MIFVAKSNWNESWSEPALQILGKSRSEVQKHLQKFETRQTYLKLKIVSYLCYRIIVLSLSLSKIL